MNIDNEEIKLLDIQILLGIVILGTLIGFLFVSYNTKLKLAGDKPFWTDEEAKTVTIFLRIVFLISTVILIFVNYQLLECQKAKGSSKQNIDAANLNFGASILVAIAAFLLLIASEEVTINDLVADV